MATTTYTEPYCSCCVECCNCVCIYDPAGTGSELTGAVYYATLSGLEDIYCPLSSGKCIPLAGLNGYEFAIQENIINYPDCDLRAAYLNLLMTCDADGPGTGTLLTGNYLRVFIAIGCTSFHGSGLAPYPPGMTIDISVLADSLDIGFPEVIFRIVFTSAMGGHACKPFGGEWTDTFNVTITNLNSFYWQIPACTAVETCTLSMRRVPPFCPGDYDLCCAPHLDTSSVLYATLTGLVDVICNGQIICATVFEGESITLTWDDINQTWKGIADHYCASGAMLELVVGITCVYRPFGYDGYVLELAWRIDEFSTGTGGNFAVYAGSQYVRATTCIPVDITTTETVTGCDGTSTTITIHTTE